MPELPEVETVRRGLEALTVGQRITGGEVLLARSVAHPLSVDDFLAQITHCQFEGWHRRGKYLLAALSRKGKPAGWLGCHLRMTGKLLWNPDGRSPHTRIIFQCENGHSLQFVDSRTFGRCWLIPPDQSPETIIPTLATLGPEPLGPDFTPAYLYQVFHTRRRPLKTLLLDQSIIAGLGNIYADEVLFQTGLHPTTPGDRLELSHAERLHKAIQQTLIAAIEAGGTSFRDYRQVTGINGNYGSQAWVYGRAGQPCRQCGTPIERLKLAGRSTHFCPQCQP